MKFERSVIPKLPAYDHEDVDKHQGKLETDGGLDEESYRHDFGTQMRADIVSVPCRWIARLRFVFHNI